MKLSILSSLIDDERLGNIITYAIRASRLDGAFAEFGVFRGGSLELIAKIAGTEREIFGIDSFEGLPEPTEYDTHLRGDFNATDYDVVRWFFSVWHPNVKIFKGYSPDVFEPLAGAKYAFVHVDVDLYQSVKDALDFFVPRMVKCGFILFDDYGFESTMGAKQALDESGLGVELKMGDGVSYKQYLIAIK